jgi:stage II sporulation protein D
MIWGKAEVYAYGLGYSHTVRVGLMRNFTNRESVIVVNSGLHVMVPVDGGFMPINTLSAPVSFTIRAEGGSVVISLGGVVQYAAPVGQPLHIMPSNAEVINMGGYSFRGVMEFVLAPGGRISAVNVVSLEEYLLGVVPAEMSQSFHMEALKAQAVASRTFTFHQMQRGRHTGFDICDRTCCQVYNGAGAETERTSQAVFATYGLMLFYNNQPILANYFSSSGGATENSGDVWFEARPYARSVNELHEPNPRIWERTFTWAQLTTAVNARNANIGTVTGISKSQLAPSGRVLNLTFHGTAGNWTATLDDTIRNMFVPVGGALPSRNFTITGGAHTTPEVTVSAGGQAFSHPLNALYAVDSRGAVSAVPHAYIFDGITTRRIDSTPTVVSGGTGITMHGRGWGHGVGMSQMGAQGMANAGYTFYQILHHYYTGVELRFYE